MIAARITATVLLLALVAPVAAQAPIVHPDTTGMDPALAEQIETAREYLDDTGDLPPAERAEAFGEIGMLYQATGFADAALSAYRAAGEVDPLDGRWPYLRGLILAETGAMDDARQALLQAMALNTGLAGSGWIRLGRLFLDQGEAELAVRAYQRALTVNPQSAAALAGMGEAQLALESFDEARDFLASALEQEPRANRLHYPLAMAYRGLGDTVAMQHHLERVGQVGLTPDDPVAEYLAAHASGSRIHILRGRKAWRAGDVAGAAAAFERAADADPNNPVAWSSLGTAQAAMGDLEQALESLQQAIAIDPAAEQSQRNLVSVLRRLDRPRDALEALKAAPGEAADPPWRVIERARIRREIGDPDAAADDFLFALDQVRDIGIWTETLAALIEAGRHDEARELATHPDLDASSDPALASLIESVLTAGELQREDLELVRQLGEHLYERSQSKRHAYLYLLARLRSDGDCDAAQSWITKQARLPDTDSTQRGWLSELSLELARAPACSADDNQ